MFNTSKNIIVSTFQHYFVFFLTLILQEDLVKNYHLTLNLTFVLFLNRTN